MRYYKTLIGKRKRISVYLKAGRNAATSYYRFFQFFDKLGADFRYHLMIPDDYWNFLFPIAIQPVWKKPFIFIYIYIRVLFSLIFDTIHKPDYIVISRCLINRVMPYSYRILLLTIQSLGTKIVFDFDDQIICAKEITRSNFDFLSDISYKIIVGSPLLKELVKEEFREKVCFMPTTDGDFYHLISNDITTSRLASFDREIRIVWLGTFSGLCNLNDIMKSIESFGKHLKKQGKKLRLVVVCDSALDYDPTFFILDNVKWSRQKAIEVLLNAHVGIMPLNDNEITRGKCSFKLIQYLSAGLPVIGTNVGMNRYVIVKEVGIGLETNDEKSWESAFLQLTTNKIQWLEYSNNALADWKIKYDYYRYMSDWKYIFQFG